MANPWDYGPGNVDDSMSFADMLSGGTKAITDIVSAGNSIKAALANGTAAIQDAQQQNKPKGVSPLLLIGGAVLVYLVLKK